MLLLDCLPNLRDHFTMSGATAPSANTLFAAVCTKVLAMVTSITDNSTVGNVGDCRGGREKKCSCWIARQICGTIPRVRLHHSIRQSNICRRVHHRLSHGDLHHRCVHRGGIGMDRHGGRKKKCSCWIACLICGTIPHVWRFRPIRQSNICCRVHHRLSHGDLHHRRLNYG